MCVDIKCNLIRSSDDANPGESTDYGKLFDASISYVAGYACRATALSILVIA